MLENFKKALLDAGYKEYTPAGNRSTVLDYLGRIENICERENLTVAQLAANISIIVKKYSSGGSEEHYGSSSHNAVRCALIAFEEFVTTGKVIKKR